MKSPFSQGFPMFQTCPNATVPSRHRRQAAGAGMEGVRSPRSQSCQRILGIFGRYPADRKTIGKPMGKW